MEDTVYDSFQLIHFRPVAHKKTLNLATNEAINIVERFDHNAFDHKTFQVCSLAPSFECNILTASNLP